jgi:hypothetical protein
MTASTAKIKLVDPRGQPPTLRQIAMAPRLSTLRGKTVYIVDINWPYTHQFNEELQKVLSERFPDTRFLLKDKAGTYFVDDPELWAEIKEHGDAMILGVGQ